MSGSGEPTHSPWGRPLVRETAPRSPWGRSLVHEASTRTLPSAPTVEDFKAIGLREVEAQKAFAGLKSGIYLSFEDAALSRAAWGGPGPYGLNEALMRAKGRKFAGAGAGDTQIQLEEHRSTSQTRPRLIESAAARRTGEGMLEVCLIDEGQGTSGYYPAETLKDAAARKVFPAGLHCYVDHPTEAEDQERPERSVRDLAGCLESDAAFRDNGLWASVRLFSSHRDFITERASTIGMSIRADGDITERARPGTSLVVPTVTCLTRALSVDFVTRAGRGGRIASVS